MKYTDLIALEKFKESQITVFIQREIGILSLEEKFIWWTEKLMTCLTHLLEVMLVGSSLFSVEKTAY